MMQTFQFIVEDEYNNIRIDKYISTQIEELSRSYVQKLVNENYIKVNGEDIKSKYKVCSSDTILVNVPQPEKLEIDPENIHLDIVYEDNDLLIVNKPQGMVVHPAPGNYTGTLVNALMYYCKDNLSSINGIIRPGIVHRIDKDTSGILMVAKNNKTHLCLSELIKKHDITRKYVAIAKGNIKNDNLTIDMPIGRHPVNRKKMCVTNKNSKDAVTHVKVLERFGQYTYIECKLETGRTHQIRVHLSHIGYPIVGDPVYGAKKCKFNLKGQLLHAKVLGFIHPTTGKYVEFESDPPEYFNNILQNLRKKYTNI